MRVYLDVCCLNRPFDDQSQARIRLESEAVLLILLYCEIGRWDWISSDIIEWEIDKTNESDRKQELQLLVAQASHRVKLSEAIIARGTEIEACRIAGADALHIACAELGNASVLLTTDDILLKKAAVHAKRLRVTVANPLDWLKKMENV
jgi:predicted nucleic acid-binding protein